MRVHPQCIECITGVRLRELRESLNGEKSIEAQVKVLGKIYRVFSSENELTRIASIIFTWVTENYPEVVERYREIKKRSIDRAKKNIVFLEKYLARFSGYDEYRLALKISIAGNILDTGVYMHKPLEDIGLEYVLSTPLSIDHSVETYNYFRGGGRRIIWLFDNAGESIYDTLLIRLLKKYGNEVIGIVKKDPGFQNDLAWSDALYSGINHVVDKLLSSGTNYSSIHLDKVSPEVLDVIREADIVVSKGMAHYEYLSEIDLGKPVFYLLIPKCKTIASSLGVEEKSFVALFKQFS